MRLGIVRFAGNLRRHNRHLLAHQSAVLADRVAFDIGVGRAAARVGAFVDLALSVTTRRRQREKNPADQLLVQCHGPPRPQWEL